MTSWTEPTDIVTGEVSDVAKFNDEVNGNLRHLYLAKAGTFGRSGALVVPNATWTSIGWNFATLETVNMWAASPYPERITPPVAGVWLATASIEWPAAGSSAGVRRLRMQQNGVAVVDQETIEGSAYTVRTSLSAVVELDGIGGYVNWHVWQSSGADITLVGGHRLSMVWLGAV